MADLGSRYGQAYFLEQARAGGRTDALWAEAGKAGFLGVNLPEEYGGGGGGMVELSIVLEELGAAGCPLLMMVVSPAICGTVIGRFGTDEQKQRWLPGLADGSLTMALRDHRARRRLELARDHHRGPPGRRRVGAHRPQGLDQRRRPGRRAARRRQAGRRSGKGTLRPALFVVPTDAPGLTAHRIPMEIISPERQFQLFLDDVRLPADALVGHPDQGIAQLFAGLNPERVMAAAYSLGVARLAMRKATDYARDARRSGARRSAPTRAWRTRWPPARSRSSAPG